MDTVTKIFKVKPPVQYKSALKVAEGAPMACSNKELIMGVELEVERTRELGYYANGQVSGLWMFERDGSLRAGRGGDAYEFISKPAQMQFLLPELQKFFEYTKFNETNYSDRCSVHVHTNVTDFTQDMLASLSMVYTVVEDVLFQYVNHYKAPTMEGYSRDTNLYCIPWNQCRMNHRLVEKLFNNSHAHLARWQKYTALNLLPITTQGTVEWRHMHGTADMEKLTTWLNLIGSIMRYSRRTQLDDVIKTILSLNDTSAYRQFFTDVTKEYLPYKEEYRGPLAEGVINAKYGLFDWDRSKKPVEEKKITLAEQVEQMQQFRAVLQEEGRPHQRLRPVQPARVNREPPGQVLGGWGADAMVMDDPWLRPEVAPQAQAARPQDRFIWGPAGLVRENRGDPARQFNFQAAAQPAPEPEEVHDERDEEEEF